MDIQKMIDLTKKYKLLTNDVELKVGCLVELKNLLTEAWYVQVGQQRERLTEIYEQIEKEYQDQFEIVKVVQNPDELNKLIFKRHGLTLTIIVDYSTDPRFADFGEEDTNYFHSFDLSYRFQIDGLKYSFNEKRGDINQTDYFLYQGFAKEVTLDNLLENIHFMIKEGQKIALTRATDFYNTLEDIQTILRDAIVRLA